MFLKFNYYKKDSTYPTHELINVDSAESIIAGEQRGEFYLSIHRSSVVNYFYFTNYDLAVSIYMQILNGIINHEKMMEIPLKDCVDIRCYSAS